MEVRSSRVFTLADQLAFADSSADWNPMHVDPQYARRLPNGRPVVHGIHTLLWALDLALRSLPGNHRLAAVKVSFPKALRIDESVDLVALTSGDTLSIDAQAGSDAVLVASIELAPLASDELVAPTLQKVPQSSPSEHSLDALEAVSGDRPIALSAGAVELFPHLASRLLSTDFGTLLQLSALVGMDCPGLNSVFSSFRIELSHSDTSDRSITYSTRRVDERFGKVDLNIATPDHSGQVTAFYRPAPRQQASFAHVQERVVPGEFNEQRALIIGGSRGLGEVFAKAIAAGGGEVAITYRSGQRDAEAVAAEIGRGGGAASALRLDVLEAENWPRPFSSGLPTHLYYLATPAIFVGSRKAYSDALEQEFRTYYVDSLERAVLAYQDCEPFTVIAPSSVAVTDTPLGMDEYANAKRAQESWASGWTAQATHHRVICDRYPRLATDQTQSNALIEALDPVEFVLERVREAGR